MPNKPAAIKALRQTKRATAKHAKIKAGLDILTRKIKKALAGKAKDELKKMAVEWQQACDKAVKGNVLKKNTANRMKSRLMAKINAIK
ncbi:MAG: 30S ribosomal protein S20 [Patescibacteria group bacterium]